MSVSYRKFNLKKTANFHKQMQFDRLTPVPTIGMGEVFSASGFLAVPL